MMVNHPMSIPLTNCDDHSIPFPAFIQPSRQVLSELLKANADVDARSITAKHIEAIFCIGSVQQRGPPSLMYRFISMYRVISVYKMERNDDLSVKIGRHGDFLFANYANCH